eukprot:TRINITY_DN3260_c0_g1_i2.p1 TRINITY_DN3260_c0_g1~~TRINITY_DN3260_c0_g1_i2.p1  ORF type:complete len:217 (-),score=13.96 TRINITY_DN3260_c0_g1_i2:141-791(-)
MIPQCGCKPRPGKSCLAELAPYVLSDGTGGAAQFTRAFVCHNSSGFVISYEATDDNIYGNLSKCHDHVWEADALEFMIYPGATSADPGGNYTELDVGAQGGFWGGAISNPTGTAPSGTVLLECDAFGLSSSAQITASGWAANLFVPFELIQQHEPTVPEVWRANLYRTDVPEGQSAQEFLAWSPTLTSTPDFHVPARFGMWILCSANSTDLRCGGW